MRALSAILALLAACAAPVAQTPIEPAAEIGSLRNVRIATPSIAGDAPLIYFAQRFDENLRAELARVAPRLDLVVGLSREEALQRATEAHGADASYATSEFLRAATNLTWVQAHSAGVERYIAIRELVDDDDVTLTNMRGVHGPAIADHVFAMLLSLTRDLPVHLSGRNEGKWQRAGSGELRPIALAGRTMFVVGLGGIGTEVARRAHGFGMTVIATQRGDQAPPPFVERVGGPEHLHEFLTLADVVAVCVPLTPETQGMIDARAFATMKPGAYLVNIARGRVVDTAALVEALRSKHLAGACLDVTDPEPLPADHELWRFANVVITPHVAADAELTEQRATIVFVENLRRFAAGEPLYNVVDKRAGY